MTGPISVANPAHEAIAALITADVELIAILAAPYVYNGAVPDGAKLPYVVIGDTAEEDFAAFMRRGSRLTVTLHIWTANVLDSGPAHTIASRLRQLFHKTRYALPGAAGRHIRGRLILVTALPDPTANVFHAVARYEISSEWAGQ